MRKILAFTDTHLTAGGQEIVGLDPAKRFSQVAAHAARNQADAEFAIVMGDITHHGRPAEYRVLRDLLDPLPWPIIPMLGNHDRRDAFLSVFSEAPTTETGHVQSARDLGAWRVLTLDTLDGPPYLDRHHAGRLCPDRLGWLDAELVAARDRPVLVFSHHPPVAIGFPGMDAIRLADPEAFLDRLADHGRAHLISGHIHRTISGSARGVPWTILKGTCHQAPMDLVTADSSLSVDEPGAYGVILVTDEGVICHSEDVFDEDPVVMGDKHSETLSAP